MNLNKISFHLLLFFILAPILNIGTTAKAETVYKWIDEDGQVNYGSRSDQENAKKIEIKNRYIDSGNSSPALSTEERLEKQKRFLNALDAEKKSISDEKSEKKAQEKLKAIRCNAARDQLKRAENSGSLYDLDEKGNRILLNKKQYEQAMKQARARVEKWCN